MNVREVLGVSAAIAALHVASVVHGQMRDVYVDQSAPPGGDGSSWTNAISNLRTALATVSGGSFGNAVAVHIAGGMYRAHRNEASGSASGFTLNIGALGSASGVSLFGGYAGRSSPIPDHRDFVSTPTVLSADSLGDDAPGFANRADNAPAALRITATRGYGHVAIDGMILQGAGSSLDSAGGGLFCDTGGIDVTGTNLTLRDNQSSLGGGAHAYNLGLDSCTVENNRAHNGGGAYSTGAWIARCVIAGNTATTSGGGLYVDGFVSNCLIVANSAGVVGGGAHMGGSLWESTISDNSGDWGGGLHVLDSADVRSCIFDHNSAASAGDQVSLGNADLLLIDCLVRGGEQGIFGVFGARVTATHVLDADPLFINADGIDGDRLDWRDNDYHPSPQSPAIDQVHWGYSWRDLDWNVRPEPGPGGSDAIADIGCYEWHVTCIADWDYSGSTPDDRDIDLFFRSWRDGEARADVNHSGGAPDDADIYAFFDAWNAGC